MGQSKQRGPVEAARGPVEACSVCALPTAACTRLSTGGEQGRRRLPRRPTLLLERRPAVHVPPRTGVCRSRPGRLLASECSRKSSCVVLQQERAEVKRATCLPAKCLAQAGVSQRPGGGIAVRYCLALHTAHAACIALQASPEREGRNERRVAYGRVGLASAQIMYKRCAYSCTMRIHRIPVPLVHPLAPGPTARRVIYRLGGQMSSPVDYLSVRAGPAFRIAPCGELRAKGFCRESCSGAGCVSV